MTDFPPPSCTHQASAVILQSEQAGSHPLFTFFIVPIHLLLYNILFNYPPLVLIRRLFPPLPLRQMFYLVCCCSFLPPFVPLSLYFPFIILYPLYHWFNLTLYDWPSVPSDPASRTIGFSLRLGNDTPHSETGSGQPLVVHRGHFKWCFFLSKLKCSWEILTEVMQVSFSFQDYDTTKKKKSMFIFGSPQSCLDKSALIHCNMLHLWVFCDKPHETDFWINFTV